MVKPFNFRDFRSLSRGCYHYFVSSPSLKGSVVLLRAWNEGALRVNACSFDTQIDQCQLAHNKRLVASSTAITRIN